MNSCCLWAGGEYFRFVFFWEQVSRIVNERAVCVGNEAGLLGGLVQS